MIIGSVFYIGYYYVTQNKNEKVYKKLQKEVVKQESKEEEPQTEESHVEIPIDFAQLQAQNPDIYAWIQIDGTNINYPVAQSATDNEYYLNHTIEGQEGYPGSIYTENWNTKEFTDFNTVIYGHDMKDGSMFQNLHNYADASYMQQHPNVVIYTPEKKLTYQILRQLYMMTDTFFIVLTMRLQIRDRHFWILFTIPEIWAMSSGMMFL